MHPTLERLVESWNTLGIINGFFELMTRRLAAIRGVGEVKQLATIGEIGEAFGDGWLELGHQVRLSGRLSRFAPIYFPIAYSPQILGNLVGEQVLLMSEILANPAPGSSELRHIDGGVLAFLFPTEARETPRITSPDHINRLVYGGAKSVPYSSAMPSVPVLLDRAQLVNLEQKVSVVARVSPLPAEVLKEIDGSSEMFVKLYYHGFYRPDWFPDRGFVLDARTSEGGEVRLAGDPAPFMVNVAVEFGFESVLLRPEVEDVLNIALDRAILPEVRNGLRGGRVNYRPGYHRQGGYEIQQVNRLPVITHLAYEKRAIQIGIVVDSTADMRMVPNVLGAVGREVRDELRRRDPKVHLSTLFATERQLWRQIGL